MGRSKPRPKVEEKRRRARQREQDALLKAEMRAGRRTGLRKRLGWPLAALGLVLFLIGMVGARSGLVTLPFDQHHILSQVAGMTVVAVGIGWATR